MYVICLCFCCFHWCWIGTGPALAFTTKHKSTSGHCWTCSVWRMLILRPVTWSAGTGHCWSDSGFSHHAPRPENHIEVQSSIHVLITEKTKHGWVKGLWPHWENSNNNKKPLYTYVEPLYEINRNDLWTSTSTFVHRHWWLTICTSEENVFQLRKLPAALIHSTLQPLQWCNTRVLFLLKTQKIKKSFTKIIIIFSHSDGCSPASFSTFGLWFVYMNSID